MLKIPKALNEEQKEDYKIAWWKTFNTLMAVIKFIVFVIVGFFIFIPLENDIEKMMKPPAEYIPQNNASQFAASDDPDRVENGIHLQTGLVYAPGFDLVKANCTVCHSAKLVTQNRANREGWIQMIEWMQETQGLWDLGENQDRIVHYLASHYAPEEKGRRENLNLKEVEWYILNLD